MNTTTVVSRKQHVKVLLELGIGCGARRNKERGSWKTRAREDKLVLVRFLVLGRFAFYNIIRMNSAMDEDWNRVTKASAMRDLPGRTIFGVRASKSAMLPEGK